MNPIVSIIIPVFNTQKEYFEPCIRSVLNQTFSEFEVLLIDDGSQTECAGLLDKWAETDTRIRLFHIENAGVSHARNYAIERAIGKYLLFIDSDDMINKYWLEWAVDIAEEEQADAVFGGIKGVSRSEIINPEKPISYNSFILEKDAVWKVQCGQLIRGMKNNDPRLEVVKHGMWGRLIKKNVVGTTRFTEDMYYREDQIFNHEVICNMGRVIYNTDEIYYLLEDRPGSATNTYDPKRLDTINAYLQCLKKLLIKNDNVYNAFYLHVLSLVDNHIDHAKKTQSHKTIKFSELRKNLKSAIDLPIFKEAIANSDLSQLKVNKSYIKLWLTKHEAITALAIWEGMKR